MDRWRSHCWRTCCGGTSRMPIPISPLLTTGVGVIGCARMRVCVHVRACVRACVCACVCMYVLACAYVCVVCALCDAHLDVLRRHTIANVLLNVSYLQLCRPCSIMCHSKSKAAQQQMANHSGMNLYVHECDIMLLFFVAFLMVVFDCLFERLVDIHFHIACACARACACVCVCVCACACVHVCSHADF